MIERRLRRITDCWPLNRSSVTASVVSRGFLSRMHCSTKVREPVNSVPSEMPVSVRATRTRRMPSSTSTT